MNAEQPLKAVSVKDHLTGASPVSAAERASIDHSPMVVAAARAMCKREAEVCGVDASDLWNLESESFKADAALILGAAGVPARLTEAQIETGWRQTFSTENPFCPCNLKSFTKAVRWAEATVLRRATGA